MAKKKQPQETQKKKKDTNKPQQRKLAFGVFLVLLSLYLVFTFSSFFFSWQTDQSGWADLSNREEIADNIGSKIGAYLGQLFVYK
ncbi:MAG: DNA translocase FtsK, partial [Capnocytophaga ochracea]